MVRIFLQLAYTGSLIVFMVGNLFAMGLQLRIAEAVIPLRNIRFVAATLIGGFVVGPALAFLVAVAVPLDPPYATGLLLLGMAPSAPFLPLVVKKAHGDLAAAAGFMLLASVGTILIMPFGVPLVTSGLSASAWSIAKPLLSLVLLPLAAGLAVRAMSEAAANLIYRYVKAVTAVGTIVFLVLVLALNFKGLIGSVGDRAFLAQLLYVPALLVAGYVIAAGMSTSLRSTMSLGLGTRNIGAAAAIVGVNGDQRIMVMLVIATIVTLAVSFAAATWFARRGTPKKQAEAAEHLVGR